MQYYKCKCGKTESFGTMSPGKCSVCEHCGTILWNVKYLEDSRPEPQPHEWITRYDSQTGESYEVCQICYARKNDSLRSTVKGENEYLKEYKGEFVDEF